MNSLSLLLCFCLATVAFSAATAPDAVRDAVKAVEIPASEVAEADLSPVDRSICTKSYYCSFCPKNYYYGYKCHYYNYIWKTYDWCYGKDYCICKKCYKKIPFYKKPPIFKIPKTRYPKYPKYPKYPTHPKYPKYPKKY
eukprot:gb/GEZJ01000732.1/.p2 GENE.gb/GEZJ01000732.1/~~gb/GEZJ01000732.1/.p2  ORF type:complete len:139 (-),score=6.53 gb/GEZJ01000732.1/:11-427(-)